jgi:alkanesulfonate monooxygenase SsuD/methylene tetrahydromethanopterin reductase-like flavin-dependent oxidoreductase (luciferase family)
MVTHDAVGYQRELTTPRRTTMPAPSIGVFLPTLGERDRPAADVVAAARHAEDLGFESAWAVDQLVAGTGGPLVDSTVALAAAAGATTTLRLAYGVLILPLRPVVWAAKQVASLQAVSGDRLVLGVGVGGDRHDRSWAAAGVPKGERGRRTDAALALLPDLVAGKAVDLDGTTVRLAPGATVPPIIVGGGAEAALVRAATHGDGWFALPVPPPQVAAATARLGELAAERGRPVPAVTGSVMAAIEGDADLPDRDALHRMATDPDGRFGMPPDAVDGVLVRGGPEVLAERLADLRAVGAARVVVTLPAGDWMRQAELLAEAAALAR